MCHFVTLQLFSITQKIENPRNLKKEGEETKDCHHQMNLL